jgi:hypothetical protein
MLVSWAHLQSHIAWRMNKVSRRIFHIYWFILMTCDPEDPHELPLISLQFRENRGIKLNYTHVCAVKANDILSVKNASVNSVHYAGRYATDNLVIRLHNFPPRYFALR